MDHYRAWGLSMLLAVGAGASAAVAADPPQSRTLFGKIFGPSDPKPKVGPAASGEAGRPMRPATVTAPLPPEVVAGALRAEQDAWERRMSVCLKLREVAAELNDESLMRQVDELERQATALYNARVSALGVPKVKAPLPEESPAGLALDRRLGSGVAVTPLSAPAAPTPLTPASGTAEATPTSDPGVRTVGESTPITSPATRGGVRP